MNKHVLFGLGAIATAHYVVWPYVPGNGDAPDAPPIASIVMPSTGFSISSVTFTVDAITDAEYLAPAVDTRHPVTVVPALPPTVTALSVGGIYPGGVTPKST
jgi:hypothetical protein